MIQVKDKVAFITGALGGIGQAYTKALLKNGLKGASLIDICDENSESFQNELSKEFGPNKTIFIKTDLKDKNEIIRAFETTVAHFKQLDIVINNAGILKEESPEETVSVNLVAPLIITELALKTFLPKYQKDCGVIINTSSIAGLVPSEIFPIYSVTKHGMLSMSSAFGNEGNYQKYKVKIFTICPGTTFTPILKNIDKYIKGWNYIVPLDQGQSPSAVGDCLLKALESNKNGSVWIVQFNKIKEFDSAGLESISQKFIQEML